MKMITAIVRTTSLERIVRSLESADVKGMTISEVKGIGDQVRISGPYEVHNRIEIIVPDDKADAVSTLIMELAHTGLAGDGLISVCPLDYVVAIRTRDKIAG